LAHASTKRTSISRTGTVVDQRLKVIVRGAVQGVGFRPFIYRLAVEMGLKGWVLNSSSGVFIEVEGPTEKLKSFILRIESEKPPISFIQSLESVYLDLTGYNGFEIRASVEGEKTALVVPDIATCPDCQREIFDSHNRRYLYPFTNCTNCGPRFTIIESLPYDRPRTSMRKFEMCPQCRAEYDNPTNRRFHAQPNACPECGPQLQLVDREGSVLNERHDALRSAAQYIRNGNIVAVKGLGGFHLMCDAASEDAVRMLRRRKNREAKPFALMYPSLEMIERDCEVTPSEARLLRSPEAPIVLLETRHGVDVRIAPSIAPGNPYLGVMLPYTPLHHLLMAELKFPVVATSGNLSDEPICIDERDALNRLFDVADVFLIHDRPILRHVDDSIARIVMDRELVLRRARGFAPLPIMVDHDLPATLAVGAHQKNAIATSVGRQIFVSQHIGDLETVQASEAFENVIASFRSLYSQEPSRVACDLHPNYVSSQYARRSEKPVKAVQHHHAHVLSCMAENAITGPVLGIAWDGSGYGPDQTIWGGEFLRVDSARADEFERKAHIRTFRLPGSETAVREPRRCAAGLLFEMFGNEAFELGPTSQAARFGLLNSLLTPIEAFTPEERSVLRGMLERKLNSPVTSSAGRLFDAVASLIGLRQFARYEGQAAMELEFAATRDFSREHYTVNLEHNGALVFDWARMVVEIMTDVSSRTAQSRMARKFHNTMVEAMVQIASAVGENKIVLSGGCFQNKLLTELAVTRLRQEGFRVYWHQRIPPNDGGIALGQVMAAAKLD
jgi:hydrogenase maturation protein HypF